MSTKGPGPGLDVLRRMQKGGPLEGCWVSFDVMHRITTRWLTSSAQIYDHNIRALCTIFTCELKSECCESLSTAWRLMIEGAEEEGLGDVHIHGFMADNASAGWNAVREVFWDGIPNPERERSDAFHYFQSLRRHTVEGILESRREEHYAMWDRLRNAKTYVDAYRISANIKSWWKAGNCVPGKLKYLEGWISWWVVRWHQWGHYIRLSIDPLEAGRMPNCTGSESVHASMWASQAKTKISLLEACSVDSNRAAFQVAAYIGFESGVHRGSGPTIFELPFRHADMAGSVSAHEKATNFLMEANGRFDLLRSGSLQGDLETRSVKRKGVANDSVGDEDSHRHDTVLITSLKRSAPRRKNLNATSFQPGDTSQIRVEEAQVFESSQAKIVNLSDSESIEEVEIPQCPPLVEVSGSTSTTFSSIPRTSPAVVMSADASTSGTHSAMPQGVPDVNVFPQGASSSGFGSFSMSPPPTYYPHRGQSSSGFSAFPQRAQSVPVSCRTSGSSRLASDEGIGSDRLCKVNVQNGTWHIGRMSARGVGPKCCGSLGRGGERDECRNFVKRVSLPNVLVPVGIAVFAPHYVFQIIIPRLTWFCPNNTCFRGRGRRSIVSLPSLPEDFVVKMGMNLSSDEISFLTQNGVKLRGVRGVSSFSAPGPAAIDRRVNVEIFPEKITAQNVSFRFPACNGKAVRLRSMLLAQHLKRIKSSSEEQMRRISHQYIFTGNGFGQQILVGCHENDGKIPKRYWVQICCFPACSCEDFFSRHTRNQAFNHCKHLYWVYSNCFRINVMEELYVSQPVMTLAEVHDLMARSV